MIQLREIEELTEEILKWYFFYDPNTGVFTRKVTVNNKSKAGDIAGGKVNGYICIGINYKSYMAHRLVWLYMYGKFPDKDIDHINHIPDDNRIENLREVTHQINMKNQKIRSNNTSGTTGVTWDKQMKKWRSQIRINGDNIFLGLYKDKEAATSRREEANIDYGFHENHGGVL